MLRVDELTGTLGPISFAAPADAIFVDHATFATSSRIPEPVHAPDEVSVWLDVRPVKIQLLDQDGGVVEL